MGQLGTRQPGLDGIRIDDALLDFVQHLNGFLHLSMVSGLDGVVADLLENEERRISELVKMVLNACDDDDPQCFTIFDDRDYRFPNLNAGVQWIPCNERTPENAGLEVLVSAVNTYNQTMMFIAFQGYGDFKWHTLDISYMLNAMNGESLVSDKWTITHWMPLPEPPEMEDNNG